MSSVFPNKTLRDIEVKRTRSGRVVIPPLAGWSGERIVSSLDDGAPLQYVSPTLDAGAQYLLSSSMFERFKKQKLIQEPFKVEESLSIAETSDRSGKSAPQLKQKSLGTGQKKSAAHKTKNVGLTRTGILKRKKAVYSLRTRHNDDECSGRRSNANEDVVLQFEHYAVDESESSESSESRRKSPSPSFEFSPVYGRKALHSKKCSHNKRIRRGEADTYLLDQEQKRPKEQLKQKNVSNDLGAIHRKDDRRSGKSNNLFIITEFQKDENDDFRISKEDVDNYYLTDEDSDTVYTNY